MNTKALTISNIIRESLTKSMSYDTYRELVTNLVAKGKSTGPNQSEALSNYSMLNDKRMQRLDKKITLSDEIIAKVNAVNKPVTWLVLTESWCGDAAQTLPVMNKVAALNNNINFKVVLRDDNEELMNAFLTNGSKSIPKLIMFDEVAENVIGTFGPRPSKATEMVNAYKETHGALDAAFKKDLQLWYTKDKGQNTADNLVSLLSRI